jgi:hypothetical protein
MGHRRTTLKSFDACYRIPEGQEPPRLGACATIRIAGEKPWNVRVLGLAVDEDTGEVEVALGGRPEPQEVGPVTEGVGRRVSGYSAVGMSAAPIHTEGVGFSAAPEPTKWAELVKDPGFTKALQDFLYQWSQSSNPGPSY